jgi:tripartite-type tricarboxylate transporter receptor subunit TctC
MRRLILIASLVLLSLVSAQAQSWPQRNVTWILPLGAGSGVDTTSRLLADRLATRWAGPS